MIPILGYKLSQDHSDRPKQPAVSFLGHPAICSMSILIQILHVICRFKVTRQKDSISRVKKYTGELWLARC